MRGRWQLARLVIWGFAAFVLLYLVMPTFIIVPLSFSNKSFLSFPPPGWSLRWYQALLENQDYAIAFGNSLKIGVPVAMLATILGTLTAIGVVRGQFVGRQALSTLALAPLVLPPIVLAIGLFPIMVKLGLAGSYPAILLGHVVVSTPLVFIAVAAALRTYSPAYELAAMTLGANPWNAFWHVTFPMIRIGVAVGFIFAFTSSFDELILAMFLTNSGTRTLPRLLWEQLQFQMTPVVAAATVCILTITIALILGSAVLARRSRRARSEALS